MPSQYLMQATASIFKSRLENLMDMRTFLFFSFFFFSVRKLCSRRGRTSSPPLSVGREIPRTPAVPPADSGQREGRKRRGSELTRHCVTHMPPLTRAAT